MFRNKDMTESFTRRPLRGEIGWKTVGDEKTEHVCIADGEWTVMSEYRARLTSERAAKIVYFNSHPNELAEKVRAKRLAQKKKQKLRQDKSQQEFPTTVDLK